MPYIPRRPSWYLPESAATGERAYRNRREFLKAFGYAGLAVAAWTAGCSEPAKVTENTTPPPPPKPHVKPPPLPPLAEYFKNPAFAGAGRPLSDEQKVLSYNNFYEFSTDKMRVKRYAEDFTLMPYTLEINGLVERPGKLALEDIEKLGYEERVYRFRCVEAWAMVVPWLGVPLPTVLNHAGVKPEAKFVAFTSFYDPDQARGQKNKDFNWPYYEALTVPEAMNELAFVATGLYGKRLAPQNGTPLRIVLPWKYGFKGPKSVVKITLTDEKPRTFWNDAVPSEYDFVGNVRPDIPHPRWSQSKERMIDTLEKVPTLPYNGYGEQVAAMYG